MKMLYVFFTGMLLLINVKTAEAQTRPGALRGVVIDKTNGGGLPFANIVIKDKEGSLITGGSSDIDGNYNINPVSAGTYNVEVSAINYSTVFVKDVLISPNAPTILNFDLEESSNALAEVVIEAEFERPLIENRKMIQREDIVNMAVRDVSSIAAQTAGVTQDARGNVQVSGQRAGETQYYLDGVKLRGAPNLPQATVQEVEVITDGVPAQYGSREDMKGGILSFFKSKERESKPVQAVVNNTESYSPIKEIPFRTPLQAPLSTFSSDVDVASYANMRRFLNDGTLPPPDAVRIEEMINYFKYDYPQPETGEVFSMTTELGKCPWSAAHQLLRIGIKTADVDESNLPDNNLVFLIDVSGSMSYANKLDLLKKSLKLLVNKLDDKDQMAIVVYAGAAGVVLEPTKGSDRATIIDAINRLSAGGSTAGGAGIKLAYKLAEENFRKNANNRVILATDGDFNVGVSSDEAMIKLIEEKRETGVFLTVLGFGTGNLQDAKMEKIADHGNGNYAYIDNLMEAQKVLVQEMNSTLHTVAKDTKFQIEFNPAQVKAYRLIGYENRILNDEDFNDDTKDAGDVGSGHSVTAVYEIIPASADEELPQPSVDPLKYQVKNEAANAAQSSELATLKIRYKMPDKKESTLRTKTLSSSPLEKTSSDFQFIAAVMQTGMLLRNSEFKGSSSYEDAIALAEAGKSEDLYGYRGEFIRLTKLARDLDASRTVGMR